MTINERYRDIVILLLGGLTPGSMPPRSTNLWQEGAVFKSLKIVEDNIFKEKGNKKQIKIILSP